MEPDACQCHQPPGSSPERRTELQLRRAERRKVRRQPDVGRRSCGDAADGGGAVGGGEEVLRLREQFLHFRSPVWGVHSGGVEGIAGIGLCSGDMWEGTDYLNHMFLQPSRKRCRREALLMMFLSLCLLVLITVSRSKLL
ncbi:unnamed protein product [Cuscuta epithymum]|uniref:Uncharacterized protein n=1 Tax=Cuscuta epithymum TaxID=186058 RepID=A0AAV0C694_9ASTE|nr:unnamed protein product [Cuscuta epithymum]